MVVLLRSSYSTFESIFVLVTVSYKDAKKVKGKVKALLNVNVKVFYFGYKRQQKDKSVLVLTQIMFPTMIPGQFDFDNKQQYKDKSVLTRSSWFNCALRDDEALYWVIIGHYEAVEVGN